METSRAETAADARPREERLLRASPRSIRTANSCLLLAAALILVAVIHFAWSRGNSLWMGVTLGLFPPFWRCGQEWPSSTRRCGSIGW